MNVRDSEDPVWTGRPVAVTGGTGFIGLHVVRAFVAAGARVVALVRPTSDASRLTPLGVACRVAPLDDVPAMTAAAAGCDVFVHLAGTVNTTDDEPACAAANVAGTRNALDAASAAGVRRFVFASSIAAVGATSRPRSLDETAPWNLAGLAVPYITSKRRAEELVLGRRGRPDVVVVNPSCVVGPDDFGPSEIGTVCKRFWRGRLPFWFGGGTNFVDVRDAAAGFLAAARFGRPGERYLVTGTNRTYRDFSADMARAAGRAVPRLRLPTGVARWTASLTERLTRPGKTPYLTSAQAKLMGRYQYFDCGKARRNSATGRGRWPKRWRMRSPSGRAPVRPGRPREGVELVQPDLAFWSGRTVAVTGGTGFLGYHLATTLADCGATVRVVALPPRPDHPIRSVAGVEVVPADVRDAAALRPALAGCSVVVHAAGLLATWGPALKRMWQVHVDGTRAVLAAADAGARIVHTSSVVALGASRDGRVLAEDDPFNLADLRVPYVLTKRAAEVLALAAGRDVVVVNPGYLVGPEDSEGSVMGKVCVRFWKGRMPVCPPGGLNLADVRDVAAGHLLAAERGAAGRRYILGGDNRTYESFFRLLAEVARYRPRGLPRMPWLALVGMAGAGEARARLTGKEPYPSLGYARMNRYFWYASSARAEAELGYAPRPLRQSLADAYRWHVRLKSVGLRGLNRWWMRPAA